MSSNQAVSTGAVEQGCLNQIIHESEESSFHKVRRITGAAVYNVSATLMDLNSKSLKKRLF
jgi:hypothetical protein